MPTVTVFGSHDAKEGDESYETGRTLGRKLVEAGYSICNGGYGGIMEATARGAKELGGKTIGVTTEDFGGPVNRWIDQEVKMKKWSERLFKLIELGDGYVALDGGTGTLVELFVVWEMSRQRLLQKPIVVLGDQLRELVRQTRNIPQVVDNPNLYLKPTPEETVKLLKEKLKK
jgi:uncharacterized protein (TIGR00730 family)